MRNAGVKLSDIAKELNISLYRLCEALDGCYPTRRSKRFWNDLYREVWGPPKPTPEQLAEQRLQRKRRRLEMQVLRSAGASLREIGARYNLSHERVRQIIKIRKA